MAIHTYLMIASGGEDVPVRVGEDTSQSTVGSTDVSGWLECSEFDVAMEVPQASSGTGRVTGRRVWRPARFLLRLGHSTPWLFQVAQANKPVDLALHFFHQDPALGEVEQYFRYRIEDGRIVSVRIAHDSTQPNQSETGDSVELQVVPRTSVVESITGSIEMTDDWTLGR